LHVRCAPECDTTTVVTAINRRLKERFGINHSTIQIDHEDCEDEHHH
jgi:cobalt-zinc-cadmium efflux system protein